MPGGEADDLLLADIAKEEYDERLKRRDFFDPSYFGEAAWDILLDLYVSRVHGQLISVDSACGASGVPHTTVGRLIGITISNTIGR